MRSSFTTLLVLAALATACGSREHGGGSAASGGEGGAGLEPGGAGGSAGSAGARSVAPRFPFGAHAQGTADGAALPAGDAAALDAAAAAAYDVWKARYLRAACGADTYTVATEFEAGNLTLSEGHGYGMLLTALMAGHDPEARALFDGMHRFLRAHPSDASAALMGWYVADDCTTTRAGVPDAVTAADGDLDAAYALLLADTQWGSCSGIDYRFAAREMLAAIAAQELAPTETFVRPGSWATEGAWATAMRTSDFMPGHLAAFAALEPDGPWSSLADALFGTFAALQASHAPTTGLLPDYLVAPDGAPAPATGAPAPATGAPFTATDGAYSWNACRVPFRLGAHLATSTEPRASELLAPLQAWLSTAISGDPTQMAAGYALDGTPLGTAPLEGAPSLAFIAPLGAGALGLATAPAWRDALWTTIVEAPSDDYFGDTLRVLALVVMSGNWLVPLPDGDCSG